MILFLNLCKNYFRITFSSDLKCNNKILKVRNSCLCWVGGGRGDFLAFDI